jgi:hypothetical protein
VRSFSDSTSLCTAVGVVAPVQTTASASAQRMRWFKGGVVGQLVLTNFWFAGRKKRDELQNKQTKQLNTRLQDG